MSEQITIFCPVLREFVVAEARPGGEKWATYTREHDGSLRRLHSHHLPLRDTREEAVQDLRGQSSRACQSPQFPARCDHLVTMPDGTRGLDTLHGQQQKEGKDARDPRH